MLTRRRQHRRNRDERGFSLVEMLVAIVILGVITVPLGDAVIGALRHTTDSSARLNESHDAQISAAYWAQDVANLGTRDALDPLNPVLRQSVETGVGYAAGLYPCGSAGTPAAVVRFASDNVTVGPSGAATTALVVVAYVVKPVDTRFELHRLRCAGSTTPESDLVLARNLVGPPVVDCDVACTGSGPAVPKAITLTVRIQDPLSTAPALELTHNGHRRQE